MLFNALHPDQVNEKLRQQKGCCEICLTPLSYKTLNVDHDHATGHLRGLLCRHCNWLLGHARDSTTILASAIVYLNHHSVPVVWPIRAATVKRLPKRIGVKGKKGLNKLALGDRVARMIIRKPKDSKK